MTPLTVTGRGIQIVGAPRAAVIRHLNDSGAHEGGGDGALISDDLREAPAFVVKEEVRLVRRPRAGVSGPPSAAPKRCSCVFGAWLVGAVVDPGVGAEVGAEVVLVCRAVKLIRATLGDHLHLAAGGAVEVGGLVIDADAELLDALDRGGDDAGRIAARGSGSGAARERVVAIVAILIARDVAAIEREDILIICFAGDFASGSDAGLQSDKRVGVAAQRGEHHEGLAGDGGSSRDGGGLKFGGGADFDIDRGCRGADLEGDVERERATDEDTLSGYLRLFETVAADGDVVEAGRDVEEDVAAAFVGVRGLGGRGGGVANGDDGVLNDRILLIRDLAGDGPG